ncbi:alpha/beta hydrolase family protein [Agrobacterium pusense]|uniref:alpha/beta hydrolase family protein n=1 Tax=Agrobacterium pusense TaxID=648995 RepID=UPI0005F04885|nr:alpha/beta fold hydrolase [Agrobacterium pusense]PTV70640.1 dienelactone hydrolase [Agrobacterium pusense]
MRILTLAMLLFALTASVTAKEAIGFKQIELPADQGGKTLAVSMWYPTTSSGKAETVGENAIFFGLDVLRDASRAPGSHPLVLLSHGYGGSWRNLNWLAGELVHDGYVAAAPDHAGEDFEAQKGNEVVALWERPRAISTVLTALLKDEALAGRIDSRRIAVIGHSLGGWTAMELAGARYSADLALEGCDVTPLPPQCKANRLLSKVGIIGGGKADPRLSMSRYDNRMAAGVETPEIAAIKADSDRVAALLPKATTTYHVIPDATHLSFMQICKEDGEKRLLEESPNEAFICRSGGGRDRAALHQEIRGAVTTFLSDALK